MKKFLVVLAVFLVAGVGTAYAGHVDLELNLNCPASVRANYPLNVTVTKLDNWDCSPAVTVSRLMKILAGNSAGTLGGAGLWGPFPHSVSKAIAADDCDNVDDPGGVAAFGINIISAVPASLVNKMAVVDVSAVTLTGDVMGGGSCVVPVVP